MHSHSLFSHKRTVSICCVCILLVALVCCVLPFLSLPVAAAEVLYTGSCGDNATYTFTDDGVLTISGTGAIYDYSAFGDTAAPWLDYRNSILSVVIENGITAVGARAFYYLQFLTSVDIPDTVQSFGVEAFRQCSKLTSVYIPSGVTAIPDSCFQGASLTSIDLPEGIVSIGVKAFYSSEFTSISLPSTLTSVGDDAFSFSKLTSIAFPQGFSSLGNRPFRECSTLQEITFLSNEPPKIDPNNFKDSYMKSFCVIWVPVGAYDEYINDPNFKDLRWAIKEIGDPLTISDHKLSDYFSSSVNGSTALTKKYYAVADAFAWSGTAPYANFVPYGAYTSSISSPLTLNSSVFYIGDIAQEALSFSLTCSVTYTASGVSQYKYGPRIYLRFYDADGVYLSGHTGTDGMDIVAGTHTITKSYSSAFPAGAVYMAVVYGCGSFSSQSAVADISSYMELSVNYAPLTPPPTPIVTTHFSPSYSYNVGATADRLEATISPVSAGELSAQWYVNTVNSTTGGTPIAGAESNFYVPVLDFLGTRYYYLEVTNTLNGLTVTVYSNVCAVTVSVIPPKQPNVTSHFSSAYTYKLGDTPDLLSVSATVADDGILSYQWFILDPMESGGVTTPIPGATESTYLPLLDFVGARYFCCAVTNTLGELTVTVESDFTLITVKPSSYTLEAGQWEAKKQVMTGAYLPLDAWPDGLDPVQLFFRSAGQNFTQISFKFDLIGLNGGYGIYYGDTMAFAYESPVKEAGFTFDAYGMIFLEADQVVSTEFYEWFASCFEYVGADEEITEYHTIINIYDNSGVTLLDSFDAFGNGVSPLLYCFVSGDGFSLIYGTGYTWSWTTDSEVFFGFATSAESAVAWWVPGETFEAGGSPSNFIVSLYVIDNSGVSVDEEFQDASLNWFERIANNVSKGFQNIGSSITDGFDRLLAALAPSEGAKMLRIIDLGSIGEFFKSAYEAVSGVFGLGDLINGEDSPFSWLMG